LPFSFVGVDERRHDAFGLFACNEIKDGWMLSGIFPVDGRDPLTVMPSSP